MPKTEEQFEKIRQEKRSYIKETALELFAINGYHSTSIAQIAVKAKMSKGLMYNYFTNKVELLDEIMMDGIQDFIDLFDTDKNGILTDEEMKYFIDQMFEILKKNTKHYRLYFSLALQPDIFPNLMEKIQDIIPLYIKMMGHYFKKKKVNDPETEAFLFGALMDGISFNYVMNPDNFPVEKVKKKIISEYLKIKDH